MKADKEKKEQSHSEKGSRYGLVLFFSVIIISLVSGYYFFALYLKKIDFDRQSFKQRLTLAEMELKENREKIRNLFFNYEILNKKQLEKGGSTNLLNLVRLAETSLLVRNFNSCMFILNLVKQDVDNETFVLAKDILNQDIAQVMAFRENPYFKVGERLNSLEEELKNIPDVLKSNFKLEEDLKTVSEVSGGGVGKKILMALKNLVVVERIKTALVMPSEREILILEMRLLINEIRMAWLADDIDKYRTNLNNFKVRLLKVCDTEEMLWGQKIFKEINELIKIDLPKIPSLEIKQILLREEV